MPVRVHKYALTKYGKITLILDPSSFRVLDIKCS